MTAPTDTVVLMPHALGVAEETLSLLEQLARERWNVRCVYSLPPAHFEDGEEFEGWAFHSSLVEPIVGRPGLYTHHGEDYSFVRRSMALGFKWWWDTRERLGHWGPYRYEWEDAGRKMPREASIAVNQKPAASRLVTPAPRNLVDARRV